jgi:hypothetical protein
MFLKGDVTIPMPRKRSGSLRPAKGRPGSTSKGEVNK